MAHRPVFVVSLDDKFCIHSNVEFEFYSGFSIKQNQLSIQSLHKAYKRNNTAKKVLEISTKSEDRLGVQLSAFNLMIKNKSVLLKDIFQYIRIPLLCIYEDGVAEQHLKDIDDAVKDAGLISHVSTVRDYYDSINTFSFREQVQTVLILMPIEAKKKLVTCMLKKIWHMQNI